MTTPPLLKPSPPFASDATLRRQIQSVQNAINALNNTDVNAAVTTAAIDARLTTAETSLAAVIASDATKAAAGGNNDITALSALSTPITIAQGGTEANTASGARSKLGVASMTTGAGAPGAGSLSDLYIDTTNHRLYYNDGAWYYLAGTLAP